MRKNKTSETNFLLKQKRLEYWETYGRVPSEKDLLDEITVYPIENWDEENRQTNPIV